MKWTRSRGLLIAALMALATLAIVIVAGCGSSSSSSASSTPSASASSATTGFNVANVKVDPSLKAMLPSGMTTIRVASDIPYPPCEYYVSATSKQATGFDYDLSQAIGAKIGVPVSFNEQPFSGIILSVKAGKNDMIMSDMYTTAVREKVLDFVDYAEDGTSVLVAKGNPQGVTNLDSLAGKTVACENGTTQQVLLQKLNATFKSTGKATMTILQLPDQPSALLAVKSGKAVGDLTDHSTAEYIAKTTNGGNSFEVVADPAAPQGYEPQLVGAGILKSNTQLTQTVQKALQGLIDDGTYKLIIAKYGLIPVTSAQVNQPMPTSSATP